MHGIAAEIACGLFFRQGKAVESGADGTNLDVAPVECGFEFVYSIDLAFSSYFKSGDAILLHDVQFFGERLALERTFLEGDI